nr:licheninase (EC 3.2.1.73) - barley [Hordeum vulgare]
MAGQGVASMLALALLLGAFASIPQRRGVHRGVLRHERQQSAGGEHRGQHVQVQRDQLHAAVRSRPGGAAGGRRHGRERCCGRAQRRALQPRRQSRSGCIVGEEQHPGVPQGLLPVCLRGQRGRRRRHPEPCPRHEERAGRAGLRRAGPHQGDHVGVAGHPGGVQPAVRRVLHRRGGRVHGPRGAVPCPHRRAAHGQHLPVPGLGLQPERHGHELRALHRLRHRGPGRLLRVPEPVRHHRGRLLHGHGQARRLQREAGGVRERVAVSRRHGGDPGQRQDLQPVPHQPRRARHPPPPGRHRDLRLLHVQREPEGQRRGAELGALLPQHAARLPHQLL